MKIIRCGSKHITGVADIFSFAFAESIEFFVPKNSLIKEAVTDIFLMLHHAMDDGFLVAVDDNGTVQGYIVVSGSIRRLWKDALLSGYVFRSLYRWLTGSYGMGPAPVLKVVRNKLFYIGFEMGTGSAGQILSIAVHPDCRGKGIGRALVDRGLNLLKSSGVSTVKLEVRPENNAALKIYSECGFVEKGRTRDLQGEWIIMQLDE